MRTHVVLRNLPHVVAAADAGSFHRATDRLGIAQSAVSRRIAEVETELRAQIFERVPSGVCTTVAGTAFCDDAHRLLTGLDHAIRRFELISAGEGQVLRVGFNSGTMMVPDTPRALGAFRRAHPKVELQLSAQLSKAQYTAIEAREIDVGIGYLLRSELPLRSQILAEDRMILALPEDHVLADRSEISIADLDGAEFMAMQQDSSGLLANMVKQRLDHAGVAVRPVSEAGSSEATLNLVAAGMGLAFINHTQEKRCPPNVVLREVAGFSLSVPIALFWSQQTESPLIAAFAGVFAEALDTPQIESMPK